jgi:hypothetical protein
MPNKCVKLKELEVLTQEDNKTKKPKDINMAHVEHAKQKIVVMSADISALPHTGTRWKGLPSNAETLLPKPDGMIKLDKRGFQGLYWDGW